MHLQFQSSKLIKKRRDMTLAVLGVLCKTIRALCAGFDSTLETVNFDKKSLVDLIFVLLGLKSFRSAYREEFEELAIGNPCSDISFDICASTTANVQVLEVGKEVEVMETIML